MNKLKLRFLSVMLVLALAGLACSMPAASNPTLPPTTAPLSPEQAQQLEQQYMATLSSNSGEVNMTITQDQLNAYLTTQMQDQADTTFTDPSVVLKNGQAEVYTRINQSGLSAIARITLEPRVDANGTVRLEVVSINLGAVPVPDVLKTQVSSQVNAMVADAINASADRFQVTNITVSEGLLTITGVPRQP